MFETILIANIVATWYMTGLIWFIQVVQYPGFQKISPQKFQSFHLFHIYRVAIVVIPAMIIELGTSLWLTVAFDPFWNYNAIGLALVIAIWISTFAIQLPIHYKLQQKHSASGISRLIFSNWIRTILWSIKAGIGCYLISLI